MPPINLQPLLDLVSKAGSETSEFQKARAAGRVAMVLFVVGLLTLLASSVTNMFGPNSHIGIIAGAASAILAVVSQSAVSLGYSASRADVKQAAAQVVSDVAAVAAGPAAPPKA